MLIYNNNPKFGDPGPVEAYQFADLVNVMRSTLEGWAREEIARWDDEDDSDPGDRPTMEALTETLDCEMLSGLCAVCPTCGAHGPSGDEGWVEREHRCCPGGDCGHRYDQDAETRECIYCGSEVEGADSVPDVDDDPAWDLLARQHLVDCEWVLTRAHRSDPRITTRIEVWRDGCWQQCSVSTTATEGDPCRDHEADLSVAGISSEDVYQGLEQQWEDRDDGTHEVDLEILDEHHDQHLWRLRRGW